MEQIEGVVEHIVYTNPENGYTVCLLDCGNGEPITAVGLLPSTVEGEKLIARGAWVNHASFGRQFRVDSYEKSLPEGVDGIYKFLSSGYIRGLGPVTAMRLVEKYGEETFSVLSDHPEWLAEFKGINKKRAKEIGDDFRLKFGMRDVIMFCSKYFSTAFCTKIYKRYGGAAVELIKANPYMLCDGIQGIGFDRVDKAAMDLGFAEDDPERIKSFIKHVLSTVAYGNGHCYLSAEELKETVCRSLSVGEDRVDGCVDDLVQTGHLTAGNGRIALKLYSEAERFVAVKLATLARSELPFRINGIENSIDFLEQKNGIEYALDQKRAIKYATSGGVTVITGGPGTGKTTVIKAILEIFTASGISFVQCAPTGRAAKRMSEASGCEAKTIHRLLETKYNKEGEQTFVHDVHNPLPYNAIIVDEVSMVDVLLMDSLLHAVRDGTYLVLIGDSDQLPPVGAGNVLSDVIASGVFPVIRLTEIFRQARESLIVVNAHAINAGELPELTNKKKDFFFIEAGTAEDCCELIANLCSTRLPKRYGIDPKSDIQIITPTRKGPMGTAALNAALQEVLNPKAKGKAECKIGAVVYREGDKVMQTRNNYDIMWSQNGLEGTGIFNGDIGVIIRLDPHDQTAFIRFDDKVAEYDFSMFEDVERAYAVTVHKSQGSEYPIVIIPFFDFPPMLMYRSLLYTGVTRAKEMFIGVGKPARLAQMVSTDRRLQRNTTLRELLENIE
ncbi:MAG: ATP-dependent RecD-like DNA helicase [Clostridia bacterium]|nr:ATP-dependent RecD-like DNA helicase [Clostridia bacterium]